MAATLRMPASVVLGLFALIVTQPAEASRPALAAQAAVNPRNDGDAVQVLEQQARALIDLGQKAGEHSSDAQVKALGATIVADQNRTIEALKALGTGGGASASIPKKPSADQPDPGPLENAMGAEFDRVFIDQLSRVVSDSRAVARRIATGGFSASVTSAAKRLVGDLDGYAKAMAAMRVR